MAITRNSTRQRLLEAALELFAQQGITETTTKQIAERAEVNEVTLFRQFGNKQGLLLAVLEEAEVFDRLDATFGQQRDPSSSPSQTLEAYIYSYLRLLEAAPEILRSVIGEAGKYSLENRTALGRGIQRANHSLAPYLEGIDSPLGDRLVGFLNSTLLGYAVLESTTEFHGLWRDRENFVADLVGLVLGKSPKSSATLSVVDLPAPLVQTIFQRAQKKGAREWALVYLLFGAGVSPAEIVSLERVQYLSDRDSQFLQITQGSCRQVPINQWILGHRYGTYQKNPLTQWLKGRKDSQTALLLNGNQEPIALEDIQDIWQGLTSDLLTMDGRSPAIQQAQQTWCVEMLMRGIDLEAMGILTGRSIEQLAPYAQRAKAKAALEQSIALDQQRKKG
jgi:AcrR family transcriptional regulator